MAAFSAAQLAKFGSEKRITQETFDAAVQENIAEFDMEPEEALANAVAEFTAQGVNLGNIIQTVSGGNISAHPAAQAVQNLGAASAAGGADAVAAAADEVAASLKQGVEGVVRAVLRRAEAAAALTRAMVACSAAPAALARVLRAAAALLGGNGSGGGAARDLQSDFIKADGPEALCRALREQPERADVAAAALQAAAATASKNEEGKNALMSVKAGPAGLECMRAHPDQPEVLQAACAVLCALTSADDDTLPSSSAFPNARSLAKEGAGLQLVAALRGFEAQPSEVTVALAGALKQIAANDEICQDVAAAGGVHLCLQVLKAGASDAALARSLCSLLRQLVSSDGNKELLVEANGLELLAGVLGAHAGNPAVLEQALGLLTNLTLRNPDAAEKALECGCLDAMLELMGGMLANGGKENRTGVGAQRQACMALRNSAVRSPGVRAALLEKGAEGLLRQIKATCPPCAEASSAALRDLGLDNYNS